MRKGSGLRLANEKLIKGCKLWDKITTKANKGKYDIPRIIDRYNGRSLYSDGDYRELNCVITGDTAEVTVGASSGHKAKVDLAEKKLRYFDTRTDNNWTMWEIFQTVYKLKCKRDDYGVTCTGISTQPKVNAAFKALASPTSMDFRRSHCFSEFSPSTAHSTTAAKCRKAEADFQRQGPKKEKA